MSPVFRSTPGDPRRLTMLAHQRARQTPGERTRIHGPIRPMRREDLYRSFLESEGEVTCPPPVRRTWVDGLIFFAAVAASAYLFVRVILPGALWLGGLIGAGL